MPAVTKKQKKLMDAAAHNPAFAKKVGIPMSVAKDYSESSKGMKFRKGGGEMKKGCATKGYAKGGLATRGEGIAKKGFAEGGMAMKNVPKKGQIGASGPDTAGPQGKTLSEPVKKSVAGDKVSVRGVGAARARVARIY
jgi:hypothetical protein